MSQTSVIFFGLLVGFIVFITIRGELSAYLQVLGLSSGGITGGLGGPPSVIPYDPSIPVIK
jgi:hypothetical protein